MTFDDTHLNDGFAELMAIRDGTPLAPEEVEISENDPFFASPIRIGEATALALAARGVAANDLWELRGGQRQKIAVNARHAAACSLYGSSFTQKRGEDGDYHDIPAALEIAHMIAMTQCWQAKNEEWLLPHTNLPHLERKVLDVLGCESSVPAIKAAIATWDVDTLEDRIADVGACAGKVRTP